MNQKLANCALLALVAICGCQDRSADSSTTQEKPREAKADVATAYSTPATNDVIVTVNGRSLTKAELEDRVGLTIALAKSNGRAPGDLNASPIKSRLLRNEAGRFVAEAILADAAEKAGTEIDTNTYALAQRQVVKSFAVDSDSFEAFQSHLSAKSMAKLGQRIKKSALIYSYILNEAGEPAKVTEADIKDVQKFAAKAKEDADKVLVEQRQKADQIYNRLVAGEEFDRVACESFTAEDDNGAGDWGDFSYSSLKMLYPDIAKAVEMMEAGDLSKPLELDDAIYIIKVVERKPAGNGSRDAEMFTLKRIVIPLPVLYEVGTEEAIRCDLALERMNKFQTETLLPRLREQAQISYPNGRILYATPKSKTKEDNK